MRGRISGLEQAGASRFLWLNKSPNVRIIECATPPLYRLELYFSTAVSESKALNLLVLFAGMKP